MSDDDITALRAEVERQGKLIDALLKHLRIGQNELLDNAAGGPPADVIEALNSGNLIEAIKRWRARTGDSLANAKARVEELERGIR